MQKILRCAIYIRVSSTEQVMHGHSLEAQVNYLSQFAENRGWKVVGVYADEGKTARKELKRRKAIKELLHHVEKDEIDMILFWKMDRWFRNVADFYKVQDILDAHNCKWTAAAEPSMNLETREGRLNVNIMLSINQNETDTTSERIKFVNQSSVAQGKAIVGTPSMPLGYKVEKVDGIKRIVKDPETEQIVNDLFEHLLSTHSKLETMHYINDNYGDQIITPIKLYNLTRSTLYKGTYRDNKEYCPAYLTSDQWDELQFINKNNIKVYNNYGNNKEDSPYIFTSMIYCPECGRRMAGMRRTSKKTGYVQKYYRCPSHYTNKVCSYGKVLNEMTTEKFLLDNIEKMFIASITLPNLSAKASMQRKKVIDVSKLEKELERLNNMYQKGRISEERYDSEYEVLSKKITDVKIAAINQPRRIHYNVSDVKNIFEEGWQEKYLQLSPKNRRTFWLSIIEKINPLPDTGLVSNIEFLIK